MTETARERFERINAMFDAVLDHPTNEQSAFIEREFADDPEMRTELRQLLRAHRRSGSILDVASEKLRSIAFDDSSVDPSIPARIGPFRIVRQVGQGGMGQVFLGERVDAGFTQRVAIKLISSPAPGLVRRFLDERRIHASLEHPHIARLIDGGVTDEGFPYFAMEFVEGESIDDYCEKRKLSLDDRLLLFEDVCSAVGYAHGQLVIHRDLKPSNILVTPDGQVKLLDFGIAKLLARDLEDSQPDLTRTGFRVLTPEVAAPEQLRGGAITTATDVYALGVLLYLLLTGQRPYDLRGKTFSEIERIVCEHEAPLPSTRVEPPVRRQLKGDLDVIVMTAMQKQASRRYQTPAALALDVQRYREGEAIFARPADVGYRLGKFVKRHRTAVAISAIAAVALVAGAVRERVLRQRAEVAVRRAAEVENFIVRIFDVADPFASSLVDGGKITARELLDRGAARIDSTLVREPEVQADLRTLLGRVYSNLGLYDKAVPLLERALEQRTKLGGATEADVASTEDLLGSAFIRQDRYDDAERLLRSSLEKRVRLVGRRDSATAATIEHLATLLEERNQYAPAESLHREVLAINESLYGPRSREVGTSLNNLGLIRHRRGAFDDSEQLYRRSLAICVEQFGERHPITAATMQNLASVLAARGELDSAEVYFRRSLEAKRASLGNLHPSVTIQLNNFGSFLANNRGKLAEGEAMIREALALDRRLFGDRHSYVAEGLRNLGVILRAKGEFAAADSVFREGLSINRALFTEPHERFASSYGNIAQTQFALGHVDEALRLMRASLAEYGKVLGDDHVNSHVTRGNLARMLLESGKIAEGDSLLRSTLARMDTTNGAHRRFYGNLQRILAEDLLQQGRANEALPVAVSAVRGVRAVYGDDDWRTAAAQLAQGRALLALHRPDEAAPLVRAASATLARFRAGQPRLATQAAAAMDALGRSQPR